jgi:hypothetical protein
VQGQQGREQSRAWRRQPVIRALILLDNAGAPEIPQALAEHAGGHRFTARLQGPKAQTFVAQFPQNAQNPAPPQQVEQRHNGTARAGTAHAFAGQWNLDQVRPHLRFDFRSGTLNASTFVARRQYTA